MHAPAPPHKGHCSFDPARFTPTIDERAVKLKGPRQRLFLFLLLRLRLPLLSEPLEWEDDLTEELIARTRTQPSGQVRVTVIQREE